MSSLNNKVVLITGGARGQGAVEGALFSNLGSTVILTDVLDDEGQTTADSLECTYLHHDVSDESTLGPSSHRNSRAIRPDRCAREQRRNFSR